MHVVVGTIHVGVQHVPQLWFDHEPFFGTQHLPLRLHVLGC
jgi:hypothetical protein